MPGILYIVATPIGNLEDMTLRALRVLKEVDVIAAEDTRHTRLMLSHFQIGTPLTSYHEHNERTKAQQLVARLDRGENIALVSDAGTPAISDPGYRLVRAAVNAGVSVVPVPGPSALAAAISAGGLPSDEFVFVGFLPAKKGQRRSKLQELRDQRRSIVAYEAPHRVREALADIYDVLGDRALVLARELTKIHEEFLRGRVSEVIGQIAGREMRGEITLIIEGAAAEVRVPEEILGAEIEELQSAGMRVKEVAATLGEKYGHSKREIYRLILKRGRAD